MKILFVTPPPYLPNRLHRVRSFDLIKMLEKKHAVHLLSVTTQKKESKEFKEIKKNCRSVNIIYLPFSKAMLSCLRLFYLPYEVAYCDSKEAEKRIEEIIKKEKIDLVYLKRLRSAIFFPNISIPVVLDTTDAMSMFYKRMSKNYKFPKNLFYLFESTKYKVYEQNIMKKIKNWIVCSNTDKGYLEALNNNISISVVPNAVDSNYFHPIANHKSLIANHSLLFRGLMDKPVNIDAVLFFVNRIFPLIQKQIKDTKVFIVGPNPHHVIKRLNDNKTIFVTGFVRDIREYIAKAAVVICPLRIGSGTRHKILQAWAMGRPVVSTVIGAEGLQYKAGENIEIANDPKSFAKKIVMLFENKNQYNKLATNGRKTVESNHDLDVISKKLDRVLSHVVKNQKTS